MLRRLRGPLLVFAVTVAVYESCPLKWAGDLFWSLPTAVSVLREGTVNLDEYRPSFPIYAWAVREHDGHAYNDFPFGSTLLALGPMWAFDQLVRLVTPIAPPIDHLRRGLKTWRTNFDQTGDIDPSWFFTTEMVLASLFMALASVFMFLAVRERLSELDALLVTAVFAFGTSVFSTATRDLGQHGPSVLMLSIAWWLLMRGARVPQQVWLAGLFVALSYVMRPTNSLSVLGLTLYVALKHRQALLRFCAAGLVVAVCFGAFNLSVWGALLPPYYRPERVIPRSAALFFEALAGNLISPGRGLFVFSPVLLGSLFGLWLELRDARTRAVGLTIAGIVTAHLFIISSFPHWWAGHSYGPRYLTDMVPYLVWLLVPVAEWLRTPRRFRAGLLVALVVAGLFSAFVHTRGATQMAVHLWNPQPLDVDQHPERLWDWRDLMFFR
jgi:hypothetical protein